MHVPRLHVERTQLLLVDFQPRVLAAVARVPTILRHAGTLAECCRFLDVPTIATEQVPEKLGGTVAEVGPFAGRTVAKTRFSAWVPPVQDEVGDRTLLIAGVETHVCVLQTVLDARAAGSDVFVAVDAVGSGDPAAEEPALQRMAQAGAVLTTTVSALYELLEDAANPRFRLVLDRVKRLLTTERER